MRHGGRRTLHPNVHFAIKFSRSNTVDSDWTLRRREQPVSIHDSTRHLAN